jgi:hypothetical protein
MLLTDNVRLWTEARYFLGPEERDGASMLHYGTYLPHARVDSRFLIRHYLLCFYIVCHSAFVVDASLQIPALPSSL